MDRQPLLTPEEVSRRIKIPVQTLYQWKYKGVGPKVHSIGRHLRYDPDELQDWINAQSADRAG